MIQHSLVLAYTAPTLSQIGAVGTLKTYSISSIVCNSAREADAYPLAYRETRTYQHNRYATQLSPGHWFLCLYQQDSGAHRFILRSCQCLKLKSSLVSNIGHTPDLHRPVPVVSGPLILKLDTDRPSSPTSSRVSRTDADKIKGGTIWHQDPNAALHGVQPLQNYSILPNDPGTKNQDRIQNV